MLLGTMDKVFDMADGAYSSARFYKHFYDDPNNFFSISLYEGYRLTHIIIHLTCYFCHHCVSYPTVTR